MGHILEAGRRKIILDWAAKTSAKKSHSYFWSRMESPTFDAASRKILRELQRNSRISTNELADKVGMSATPCWRRQKELEEKAVIVRYAAIVDRCKIDLSQCCLLHISLTRHDASVVATFEEAMKLRPEVMECYEVTGTSDYM